MYLSRILTIGFIHLQNSDDYAVECLRTLRIRTGAILPTTTTGRNMSYNDGGVEWY